MGGCCTKPLDERGIVDKVAGPLSDSSSDVGSPLAPRADSPAKGKPPSLPAQLDTAPAGKDCTSRSPLTLGQTSMHPNLPPDVSDLLEGIKFGAQVLGCGTYGVVVKGWWNSTEVALKVMVSEDHRDRAVQREVKVGPTLTHPHVVTVYGTRSMRLTDELYDLLEEHHAAQAQQPVSPNSSNSSNGIPPSHSASHQFLQHQDTAQESTTTGIVALQASLKALRARKPSVRAAKGRRTLRTGRGGGADTADGVGLGAPTPTGKQDPSARPSVDGAAFVPRHKQQQQQDDDFDMSGALYDSTDPLRVLYELLSYMEAAVGQLVTIVVMECCMCPLSHAVARGVFTPAVLWPQRVAQRALVRTLAEVARGLLHMHRRGVLHGDIKPGNVLLKPGREDRRGFTAKLCDFGQCHVLPPGRTSMESRVWGTVPYMSPEALRGQVSTASDVWAFGALLYEMVTGRVPYGNGTSQACLAMGIQEGVLHIDWPDCSQCGSPTGNGDGGGGGGAPAAGAEPAVRLHDILLALTNTPAAAAAGSAHEQVAAAAAGPYCGPGSGTPAETANNPCRTTNHSRAATPAPIDVAPAPDNDAATPIATPIAAACSPVDPAPPASACGRGAAAATTSRIHMAAAATTPGGMTSAGTVSNGPYQDDATTGRLVTRALVALGRMCTREDPEARPCMAEVLGELLDIEQLLRQSRGLLSGPGGSLGTGAAVSRASTGVTCAMEGRGSVDGGGAGAGVVAGGLFPLAGVR